MIDVGDSALKRLNGVKGFTNRGSGRGWLEVKPELTLNEVEGFTTVRELPANLCCAPLPHPSPIPASRDADWSIFFVPSIALIRCCFSHSHVCFGHLFFVSIAVVASFQGHSVRSARHQ